MTEQENKNRRDFRIRLLFSLLLAAAAVLLLGAGRIGDSLATRQAEQERVRLEWQAAVGVMLHPRSKDYPVPKDYRLLSDRHPEYILQTVHLGLRPEKKP